MDGRGKFLLFLVVTLFFLLLVQRQAELGSGFEQILVAGENSSTGDELEGLRDFEIERQLLNTTSLLSALSTNVEEAYLAAISLRPQLPLLPGSNEMVQVSGSLKNSSVFAHSAYWNPLAPSEISVSILSDASRLFHAKRWNFSHRCLLLHPNGSVLDEAPAETYTQSNMLCKLSRPFDPTLNLSVFLYREKTKGQLWRSETGIPWSIPILAFPPAENGHIAHCLKVLYRDPDWLMLFQFLEYYRGQGVHRFLVKARGAGLSVEVKALLAYYASLGLVEVMEWNLDMKFCGPANEYCALEQIQDCVMRSAALGYAFTIVSDYDELIRGKTLAESLPQLLRRLQPEGFSSATFRAKYVLDKGNRRRPAMPSKAEDISTTLRAELPWLRFSWKRARGFTPPLYSPKTIVRPRLIRKMWVHFASEAFGALPRLDVDPLVQGYMYHFKNYTAWGHHWYQDTVSFAKYEGGVSPNEEEAAFARRLLVRMSQALTDILRHFQQPWRHPSKSTAMAPTSNVTNFPI